MRQIFIIIGLLMVSLAVATPANNVRRVSQQERSRDTETQQQSDEGQSETPDPENASDMTRKILECRNILQQAGMVDMNQNGKPTETHAETETEAPKGFEFSVNRQKSIRKF